MYNVRAISSTQKRSAPLRTPGAPGLLLLRLDADTGDLMILRFAKLTTRCAPCVIESNRHRAEFEIALSHCKQTIRPLSNRKSLGFVADTLAFPNWDCQ